VRRVIEWYKHVEADTARDYSVGCILLQSPFFLTREEWFSGPDWHKPIVQEKGYTTDEEVGDQLWREAQVRLQSQAVPSQEAPETVEELRFGQPQTVLPRFGQGAFRVIVTDGHKRQCALIASHVLHVLDAAHIRPYSLGGPHIPSNGLLRQDVHTLFDRGYLTGTPDCRVRGQSPSER
jgi:putative restriction endonuclease